jgi:hypothetical protein
LPVVAPVKDCAVSRCSRGTWSPITTRISATTVAMFAAAVIMFYGALEGSRW